MMKITLQRLASDVATLLGESLALECEPEESPFPGVMERVRLMASEILSDLICGSPLERLSGGKTLQATAKVADDGMVTIELPEDFLRLVNVKMSDWNMEATVGGEEGSLERALQASGWKGLRGQPERPVAVLDTRPGGKRMLRLYSSGRDAELEYGSYIPRPVFDTEGAMECPDALYGPLLMRLAEYFKG